MNGFDEMVNMAREAQVPGTVHAHTEATLANLPARQMELADAETGTTAGGVPSVVDENGRREGRRKRGRITRLPWAIAAAACVVIAACLVAWPLAQSTLTGTAPDPDAASSSSSTLGGMFKITPAYGVELQGGQADGGVFEEAWEDDGALQLIPGIGYMGDYGYFTGLEFKVEGENIAEVNVSTTEGELYRMTRTPMSREEYTALLESDQPLEGEGFARVIHYDTTSPYDDSNPYGLEGIITHICHEGGAYSKKFEYGYDDYYEVAGSSFSGTYAPDAVYGFYQPRAFNDSLNKANWFSIVAQSFDNAVVEVTVTYADGRSETQKTTFHCEQVESEYGHGDLNPETEDLGCAIPPEGDGYKFIGWTLDPTTEIGEDDLEFIGKDADTDICIMDDPGIELLSPDADMSNKFIAVVYEDFMWDWDWNDVGDELVLEFAFDSLPSEGD